MYRPLAVKLAVRTAAATAARQLRIARNVYLALSEDLSRTFEAIAALDPEDLDALAALDSQLEARSAALREAHEQLEVAARHAARYGWRVRWVGGGIAAIIAPRAAPEYLWQPPSLL